LETSEELKTDIIAVGCKGLRGIKGMMGSVSRNILTSHMFYTAYPATIHQGERMISKYYW
jgi:hypothetical protein